MAFVHLHSHTEYSLLDGLQKIPAYVRRVKELGMTAAAITDHGVAYGLVDFYNECKKQGIKPILGCEFYIAPGSMYDKDPKNRYYHLIVLVKNDTGYKNLCRLVTRANKGFYYKPRIDFELLSELHEGLIVTSACIGGEIAQKVLKGDEAGAKEAVLRYKSVFGDDYYLEIQRHGINDEDIAFDGIIRIARELGVKLVCTNDCHYTYSEEAEAHEWLVAMQEGKKITEEHTIYQGDYSVLSEKDMREKYPSLQDAFDNTCEVAEKCNFEFEFGHYRMPKVVIPEKYGDDYFGYLKNEAYKGFIERYPQPTQEVKDRLDYELSVVKQMGFAEYFLDTRKTIFWAREHDIPVGPGRGSGAGSVMNYSLKITDLDPIKYNLLFERFLNPERISMPDIDVDYSYNHKDEVVRSEAESNGYDKFAKIQTFGTMKAKGVIRDCIRTGGYPYFTGATLSKMIPKNDPDITLLKAAEMNPDIPVFVEENKLEKVWDIALKIEGLKKSASTHACGHIPTPVPCEELFPCSIDAETGYLVCQYNMVEAEHLGNLKKDLLMLRNLTVIEIALKEIKRRKGIDVPLWNDDILDNKAGLELIARGDTDGVFQLESEGMKNFMKKLKPDCFEDIIAGVALYRPGPMEYIPRYIEGKKDPSSIKYLTPELEPIISNTYGVIVYQEQVMQIVQKLAGYTMGRADVVRKAMGRVIGPLARSL